MVNGILGYDLAVKTILYSRFASILGVDTQTSIAEENINLGVFQCPKEVAQRVSAEKRGETFLEFINYWRMGASFSWERNRTPLARRGMRVGNDVIKAVPIDLNYNVWFWSKDLNKIYQVIEDYAFWQQDNPKVTLLYDEELELTPDIHFGEIVDESTVGEQYAKGLIYVYRMPVTVDGWVLRGVGEGAAAEIIHKIRVRLYDKDDVTNYSEIIVEDSDQDTEMEAALRFFSRAIYGITSVSLSGNSISITGNFAADFAGGDRITIWGSTDNNEVYTVASEGAIYADGKTTIVVQETLVSETADGTIYK